MRFALIVFVVILASLATGQEGSANQPDGNDLLPRCQASVDSLARSTWRDAHEAFSSGFCTGLVQGIAYASPNVCLTKGVTNGQMMRVVVKFLEGNPEKLNLDDDALVDAALSKAFPCPKLNTK